MTQGTHPVVEQLGMTGTRSAILEQDHQRSMNNLQKHGSRAVTLGGLKSEITEWRRRSAGDAKSVDNMSTPFFFTRLRTTNTASLQEIYSKNGLVQLRDDCSIRWTELTTNQRAVIKKNQEGAGWADVHGSATPRPPESVRPAATPSEEPSVAANRDVIFSAAAPAGLLTFATASSAAPVSFPTSSTIHTPGVWTLSPSATTSPTAHPAYRHTRPRDRR